MPQDLLYLYGGDQPWDSVLWVTTDDRVRGGSSQSYLSVANPERARFHGNLDTSTLGGAGFASQHSLGELALDLSAYDGIVIDVVGQTDGKRYAVTLKDDLLPPRDDGRERSGVSWQAEFVPDGPGVVKLPWSHFKATYRGRDKPDEKPLDRRSIKRVGLMMRSFFAQQDGDFSLEMHYIAAWKEGGDDQHEGDYEEEDEDPKAAVSAMQRRQISRPRWKSLFCGLL